MISCTHVSPLPHSRLKQLISAQSYRQFCSLLQVEEEEEEERRSRRTPSLPSSFFNETSWFPPVQSHRRAPRRPLHRRNFLVSDLGCLFLGMLMLLVVRVRSISIHGASSPSQTCFCLCYSLYNLCCCWLINDCFGAQVGRHLHHLLRSGFLHLDRRPDLPQAFLLHLGLQQSQRWALHLLLGLVSVHQEGHGAPVHSRGDKGRTDLGAVQAIAVLSIYVYLWHNTMGRYLQ